MLNFEDVPPKTADEISNRAKTIFEINAPNEKEAGSPYLQAKVYWARIRLEHAVKIGEIVVEPATPPPDATTTTAAASSSSTTSSTASSTTEKKKEE